MYGDFPAKNTVFTPIIYIYIYGFGQPYTYTKVMIRVGQNHTFTPYMTVCMYGDFPAKNTVFTPYIYIYIHIYGFGQPYTYTKVKIRVGQNRIYTPYMTVCMMISLPKTPYLHRIYL